MKVGKLSVITARDLTKRFHGNDLFVDANFEIEEGKTYGLVGTNGSGKSVLFKMICGLMSPDSGEIAVDSRFMSAGRTFPADFGLTVDGPAYLPNETGFFNLKRLARIRNVIGDAEIAETMWSLGLDPDSKIKVRRYSLGMKQKLSIAQALMENPRVLLLDEPFNALDAHSVQLLKEILRSRQTDGVTIVFTSHNRSEIDELSDEVLQIDRHQITPASA